MNLIEGLLQLDPTRDEESYFDRIYIVTRSKTSSNFRNLYEYLPKNLHVAMISKLHIIEYDFATEIINDMSEGDYSDGILGVEELKSIDTIDTIFHLLHINEADWNGNGEDIWISSEFGGTTCYQNNYPSRQVVHMGHQYESRQLHYMLNFKCMDMLLYLAQCKNTRRFVYCSSWSSYGIQPSGTIVTERTLDEMDQDITNAGLDLDDGEDHDDDLIQYVEQKQPKIQLSLFGTSTTTKEPNPYSVCKQCCELKLRYAIQQGQIKGGMIIQPTSILGKYSKGNWSSIFYKLYHTNGNIPGLPGTTSVVDVRDLTTIMMQCSSSKKRNTNDFDDDDNVDFGVGECYVVGGNNISNIGLMSIMSNCVGVASPTRITPLWIMMKASQYNEFIITLIDVTLPRLLFVSGESSSSSHKQIMYMTIGYSLGVLVHRGISSSIIMSGVPTTTTTYNSNATSTTTNLHWFVSLLLQWILLLFVIPSIAVGLLVWYYTNPKYFPRVLLACTIDDDDAAATNIKYLSSKLSQHLLIKPNIIGSPFTTSKICQSQTTEGSLKTKTTFNYHPRPIEEIVKSNYDWLVSIGELQRRRQEEPTIIENGNNCKEE